MARYYTRSKQGNEGAVFALSGDWNVASLSAIAASFSQEHFENASRAVFDAKDLNDFDTSCAWFLNDVVLRLHAQGVSAQVTGLSAPHQRIFERVAHLPREKEPAFEKTGALYGFFKGIGAEIVDLWGEVARGIGFVGECVCLLPRLILDPRQLRLRSVIFHINEVGIKALPVIALMAFSISIVTGYQGAFQLRKFGADVFTIDLIAISTLREMGVLLTAIMLAGRSGSAFAAQIGTMRLNEEVDALQTMGVPPFRVLVMPRILAILISLPLLTLVADAMGLLGGYVFSNIFMGFSFLQFMGRVEQAVNVTQLCVGLVKAPVFALLIGMVGCLQGMSVRGSAEDVGRKTTAAVVQSIFLVIVADALFSIVFTRLGI